MSLSSRPAAWVLVAALLAGFFALAVTSVLNKSNTYDETVHIAAGIYYWKLGDYRLDPENGNLPQRWMALPMAVADLALPSFEDTAGADQWVFAHVLFYGGSNKPEAMLLAGRVMIALLAVGLGVLVYAWSARLFGRGGGLISTVLYAFSTTLLAHGRLATSDLTAALMFLASVGCLWRMLHCFTPFTVLGSALVMGLLFVSKMSGVLIAPMGVLLVVIRLIRHRPLLVKLWSSRQVSGRWRQVGLFAGAVVVHALVVVLVIWTFYGFRYAALHPDHPGREPLDANWPKVLAKPFPMQDALVFFRDHRLLPEAYLFGQAHVLKHSQVRLAFLSGRYSVYGWWWFFPYCFLIKTPLSFFVVLVLAAVAAVLAWRTGAASGARRMRSGLWEGFYRTAPLWVLLGVYWATAIISKINIGHRHILVTYPAMFILAGSAVELFRGGRRSVLGSVLGLSLVAYAGEGLWTWPHYLAYFNQLVGGSGNGYRHLVDSSLDWGQDLPGLKRWLDRHGLSDPSSPMPVYLSYFGAGSPAYYGIRTLRLPGFIDLGLPRRDIPFVLTGGVYCISATMLQTVIKGPPGPWTAQQEETYQAVLANVLSLIRAKPEDVQATLQGPDSAFWTKQILVFEQLRFKRLCVYLRHRRQPDDQVGYSILIYRLDDEEVDKVLLGPPVEIRPEDPSLFIQP